MKAVFLFIFLFACGYSYSQTNKLPTKIFFCKDSSTLTVDVEIEESIFVEEDVNTVFTIMPKDDNSSFKLFYSRGFNSKTDLRQDYHDTVEIINKVKIFFSFNGAKINQTKIELLTNYLQISIIDSLKKNRSTLFANDFLFYGLNDGALVLLNMAKQNASYISKTAVYFNNYEPLPFLKSGINSGVEKCKGKLFVYTTNEENKLNSIDEILDELALKSSIMVYRIDTLGEPIKDNTALGYKWLMANGNNIILKTDF